MGNLFLCLRIILCILICGLQTVSGVSPAVFTEFNNERNIDNCSWKLIKNLALRDVTVVNVKDNEFLKYLNSYDIKILNRSFLSIKLEEPNEAYIVSCDHLQECENGFDDLLKDRYWNPSAIFVIIVKTFSSRYELIFRKLHYLYVFKTVLVFHNYIYVYDFQLGDHCSFTANAIREYSCACPSSDSSIWADIKGTLKERHKTPYSECNFSVIVSAVIPSIFPPLDCHDESLGYEEEFIRILNRINFTNLLITYNLNVTRNGLVCENYTVTGILQMVQNGNVDYIVGNSVLSHYRLQLFDFTYPHFMDDFVFVVPKAGRIDKWEVIYKVFKPTVWALICVAFLCVILIAYILQIHSKRNWDYLMLTTLILFGYLTNNASKKKATIFMFSWILFSWLITSSYQSDLTSIFTKPIYYEQINSLPEILSHNYKLYLSIGKYNYMTRRAELDIGGLVQKSILCKTDVDSLKAVAFGRKLYTVGSRLNYPYFEAEFHKETGESMLHQVVVPYFRFYRTGYLRKGNPNLKRIRFLERHIIAFGFQRRSMLTYIHMNKLKYFKFKKKQSEPFSFTDVAGIYYLYFCGCGISLVAFLIEIIVDKCT